MREKIEALIAELRGEGYRMYSGDPWDDGYIAACRENADRLTAILAADAGGWALPPHAGICADDLDEYTITLALSSEAEVHEARAKLPLRHRVRIWDGPRGVIDNPEHVPPQEPPR